MKIDKGENKTRKSIHQLLKYAAIIGLAYMLIVEIILPEKILLKEFMTAFMEPPFKPVGLIIGTSEKRTFSPLL